MNKKFFLVICILTIFFGMTTAAYAASINDLITYTSPAYEPDVLEIVNDSSYVWKQDTELQGDTPYVVYKAGSKEGVKTNSILEIYAYDAGVLTFDYYIEDLAMYSHVYLEDGDPLTPGELEKTNGRWKTMSIVFSDETDYMAALRYYKLSSNAVYDVAIRNVRFSNEAVGVNYGSSNSLYGTVSGSVANGTKVASGTTLTLTANPEANAKFFGWMDQNGDLVSTDLTLKCAAYNGLKLTAVMEPSTSAVAKYNGELYYRMEHALEAASKKGTGQITLIGDTEVSGNIVIPRNIKLFLPYNDASTSIYEIGMANNSSASYAWLDEAKYLNRTLTITPGSTLDVKGQLLIGGIRVYPNTSAMQGHTSGAYAQIINHGTIYLTGTMEVHGRIQGNGTVKVASTGVVHEPFVLIDYAGGNNTGVLYQNGKQFPMSQYACPNIQNRLEVISGGKILGMAALFISGSTYEVDDICIVAGNDAATSLIRMADNAVLVREVDKNATLYPRVNVSKIPVEKARITVNGGGEIGTLSLSLQGMFTFKSSNIYLGLPYNFDVALENGEYTLPADGFFRIMPGAVTEIAEDASLTVKGKLMVYDGLYDGVGRAGNYYPDEIALHNAGLSSSGNLIVNGTLNLASGSSFGGVIQTEGTAGKVKVASGVELTNSNEKYGCEAGSAQISIVNFETKENNAVYLNLPARIRNLDGTIRNLEAGKTYEATGNSAWTLTSYQEQRTGETMQTHQKTYAAAMTGTWDVEMYDVRFYTDSSKTELFDLQRYAIGSGSAGVTPSTAPTKASDSNYHYTFKQWSNSDYLKTLTGDVDVYAEYTASAHGFVTKNDGSHHWQECSTCGYVKGKTAHTMGAAHDTVHHWTKCSGCTYTTARVAHSMSAAHDTTHHWTKCSGCTYTTAKVAHSISAAHDTTHHWTKCSGCTYETAKVAHTLEQKKDANGHWDECTAAGCDYAAAPAGHEMVTKYNDEYHWSVCKTCSYTDGTQTAHTMTEKTENGETWMQCTGCKHSEGRTVLLGDVNLDGFVDANDLTTLARHVAEIEFLTDSQALRNGDVNRDGVADAEDLTMLARYVAEIIDSFE